MAAQKKRTRLSPEARRQHLLDVARAIVAQDGLSAFTMERVGREAEVSSQLVYNYFPSRLDLLRALYDREYDLFHTGMAAALSSATTFEEVARAFVEVSFDNYAAGNVLTVLRGDTEITEPRKREVEANSKEASQRLLDSFAADYSVTKREAYQLLTMASGAAEASAALWGRSRISRESAIDATMRFIVAGVQNAVVS